MRQLLVTTFAIAVVFALSAVALAEDPATYVKEAKLVLEGKAKANGEIPPAIAFDGGEKKDVKVTVAEKMGKQDVARDLAKELTVALGEGYEVEQYDDDKIEIEAKTLAEVRESRRAGADVILLDNMPPETIRRAVATSAGAAVVEVSGGVRLETLRQFALPGIDVISVGALTHSATAVDLSLTIPAAARRRQLRS